MENMKPSASHRDEALVRLRRTVPRLCRTLSLVPPAESEGWERVFDSKLLPRISPDFPLVAAICGGGSSGKSTLFNTLAGERLSPTGGSAGINRRVLVCGRDSTLARSDLVSVLFEPFGCPPEPFSDTGQLTEVGCPVYAPTASFPEDLLLMDTPDFDTGARGAYVNRETARRALEAADILIYIFTNSNYNNLDNTDFISRMLTGIGRRRCLLVYRVYPSFSDDQVRDHAMVVARNLYGADADAAVLGIYRADEDNRVAAGKSAMALRPVPPFDRSLMETLSGLDPRKERGQLQETIVVDVLDSIRATAEAAEDSLASLNLYLDALLLAQSRCIADSLRQIPMEAVMRRFADIWLSTDPTHVRVMRKAGSVVEAPLRLILAAARWARKEKEKAAPPTQDQFQKALEEDLLSALHRLYAQAVGPEVSVSGPADDPAVRQMREAAEADPGSEVEAAEKAAEIRFRVTAPEVTLSARRDLERRPWQEIFQSVMVRKPEMLDFTSELDRQLSDLVDSLRDKMGLWDQTRQTFSAMLNIVPATAAVTYVLHTGDPVGAAGIKVKLTGLFGLHDLVALVAIPATSGMKKADRSQLESMLVPIARAWLTRKLAAVQEVFETEITGPLLRQGRESAEQAEALLADIEKDLNRCEVETNRT